MGRALMSEATLQAHVVKLLQAYARHDVCWFHVPNGELRDMRTAAKLKLAGVRAGVADLILIVDGRAHGLELKTETGRLSDKQVEFCEDLERAGGFFHAAYGIDQAIGVLTGLDVFRPNITITTAFDGNGARSRPRQSKAGAGNTANLSPVKPRRAADPVSPIQSRRQRSTASWLSRSHTYGVSKRRSRRAS